MSLPMPGTGPVAQPAVEKSAVDSTVEYLILEIVRYYSIGQDLVAAVHAVETMGFRIGYQLAERCATAGVSLLLRSAKLDAPTR